MQTMTLVLLITYLLVKFGINLLSSLFEIFGISKCSRKEAILIQYTISLLSLKV